MCRQQVRTGSLRGACPGTLAGMFCRVVFGTLLGPEATGPWPAGLLLSGGGFAGCGFCLFLVSWLHRSHGCLVFWRGVCGVCGTGLLFENYIVDASIFYKKQFPRI
jgi:hypothetical protein